MYCEMESKFSQRQGCLSVEVAASSMVESNNKINGQQVMIVRGHPTKPIIEAVVRIRPYELYLVIYLLIYVIC